jgi:membrane protease YdiL (CAAX protease family)
LPWILLFAATNAFGEEMLYRSALLAPTHKVLGGEQAILLTATFFGIGHYYGVPYGITGVLLAGFFGWVLGWAMLETRGFFWPWMIHMVTDVVIFSFIAMGAVTAGGL